MRKALLICTLVSIWVLCIAIGQPSENLDQELKADVIERRAAIARSIGDKAMLILFSAPVQPKTGDVSYEYRQQNNLYYLTGIHQSETILAILPGNEKRKEFLFVSDRDPRRETWTGKILSHQEATDISGIPNVYSVNQFESFIDSVLAGQGFDTNRYAPSREYDQFFDVIQGGEALVYLSFENRPGLSGELTEEFVFANKIRDRFVSIGIRDAWPILTRMRQVKSDYEIRMLREAISITEAGILEIWKALKPGLWEYEAEAPLEAVYKQRNAFDWGFPSIIASGPNATTLHYESSQRQMQAGELLLTDVGAEYRYYTADITRTVPVGGKFSPEQAAIYQIVYDAQEAAFRKIKPGANLPEVHLASAEVVKQGLKKLGLITDVSGNQYKMWFMHGTSHWLGMEVHDTGETWRLLEPGMIFTVEPGIYLRADGLQNLEPTAENEKLKQSIGPAFEKYKNIGVRIEDDVMVTTDGYELLSNKVPRAIAEIEQFLKK